ncbi:relaxase/mobilization nuclease domain-containing protein [Duganella sp. FT135W]|uniref:Relaxase/mobilization nuclease domain-containing protein n=1 Tax=Duganella flavida TaxID=2692175 RepID=A0A6L8K2P6_9BURK|nr:TraI/MobA(P) family conjugative relaxase [Duganella flavida]MYM21470.1 relaxase/mobilization nuclease domain-containing protein [Duganella flavida]
MIVKKIKNPKKSASKSARVGRLMDYICAPEQEISNEKCLYAGARGFLSDDHEAQKAEMLALSQEAVRSPDTINHYVLSWQEGEQPSSRQVEEAVDIFLKELGLEGHQTMYGLHADTDNVHLHIAINRVNPKTLKVIKPNRGFDIEAAHKAVARIEEKQGWQREAHGRYRVKNNGEIERDVRGHEEARQPEQAKCDMEQRTGEKSAERVAIETGAPIIKAATSWQDLHQALAKEGMRYERTGSGAVLFVNDIGVKASRADREASLGKLEKRLGTFEPSTRQKVVERAPEPVKHVVRGWKLYSVNRRAYAAEKDAVLKALRQCQEAERKALLARHQRERAEVLQGRWNGRGELRNALESIVAARRAVEQAEMRDRQRTERAMLRERYRPYPDLEQWLRQQEQPELAEQWRYRATEVQQIRGDHAAPARPRDIRDYVPKIEGGEVRYARGDMARSGADAAFVDKGGEIDVYAWRERASVLAALQLAEQKWGSFEVTGRAQFKMLCVELAVEHGFKLDNPELQQQIAQEQRRLLEARAMSRGFDAQQVADREGGAEVQADLVADAQTRETPALERSAKAYASHYRDVLKQQSQGGRVADPSRVDAMIAVRMRATGHTQQQVEAVLRQCAPATRQKGEVRDWENYAKRTAEYAFGASGQQQADALKRYWQQWQKLEGREAEQQRERGRGMSR